MVKIRQSLISGARVSLKSPYKMTPKYITIHNTANDASASNEARYHNSNNNQVSFHYAVDDKEIVQVIPDNRNAWHCGDGRGEGNMKSIGIEICYSKSGGDRYLKSEQNAVELTAFLLKKHNLPIGAVRQHHYWSGKDCPHRIRATGSWNNFLKRVQVALDKLNVVVAKAPTPAPTKALYKIKSGTFNTRAEAERAKQKVAQNKLANINYITIHEDKGKFYFQTGTYANKETAEIYLKRMKALKIIWVGTVVKS